MSTTHTKGPWKLEAGRNIVTPSGTFCLSYGKDKHGNPYFKDFVELDNNAALIAEAGTVAHETGRTPRQLADLNTELLAALKDLYYFADGIRQEWESNNPNGVYNPLRIKHLMAAKQAIAKAEGRI